MKPQPPKSTHGPGKAPAAPPLEVVQLATFYVGDEEYALDIMKIQGIVNPAKITPVPRAPAFLEGVIELRGAILPVVDLRKRFDLPAAPPVRATKYVLVELDGKVVALIVDGVTKVIRVPRADVRPPPPMVMAAKDGGFFSGVCHHGGRILMVLDIDRVLSSQEKITLAGMSTGSAGHGGGEGDGGRGGAA